MSAAIQQEVKEKPVIFSGPMTKAILSGTKTQTRRVIKPQPTDSWMREQVTDWSLYYTRNRWGRLEKHLWICHPTENKEIVCPYGKPGDQLWVRERWYCAGEHECDGYPVRYEVDADLARAVSTKWRTPIFMPRWASRITLEITNIRVQRVQEISEADAIAEGVRQLRDGSGTYAGREGPGNLVTPWPTAKEAFADGWDAINAKRGFSWSSNVWVWVLEFKKL
jgi:hypothetical protein